MDIFTLIAYLVWFILPIFVGYIGYTKYLNKAGIGNVLTTGKKFLHIIISHFIAGFTFFLSLFILAFITLVFNIEFLHYVSSYLAMIIMAISYYISLKIFLSKQEGIDKKNIKEIVSNTTGFTFGIFILLGIVILI